MNLKFFLLVFLCFSSTLSFSNNELVEPNYTFEVNNLETKVDYSIWEIILKRYIDMEGNVDYDALKKKENMLDDFLNILEKTKIDYSWNASEKIAFWINVYNAYTIKLILKNYPVKSIKDIKKPWDKKFFTVNGEFLSLGDVEHQILRKKFTEPRIHFAINCASKSCPRIVQIPYTGDNLNNLLDRQTKEYINSPELNNVDSDSYQLSKLFSWFSKDFKEADGSVVEFINRYSKTLIKNQKSKGFIEYDWNLNTK